MDWYSFAQNPTPRAVNIQLPIPPTGHTIIRSISLLTAFWNGRFSLWFQFRFRCAARFFVFMVFFLRIVRFSTLASMTRPLVIRFNWYIGAWGPTAMANRHDLGTFEAIRIARRRWRGASSDLCAVRIPRALLTADLLLPSKSGLICCTLIATFGL